MIEQLLLAGFAASFGECWVRATMAKARGETGSASSFSFRVAFRAVTLDGPDS
jgi:hypothetical protein